LIAGEYAWEHESIHDSISVKKRENRLDSLTA
jgi:hypothetical protein